MLIPSQSILLFGILLFASLASFAFFIWSGVYNEKDQNDAYKVKFDTSWPGTWILLTMFIIFGLLSLAMFIMILVITMRSKRCKSCKNQMTEDDIKIASDYSDEEKQKLSDLQETYSEELQKCNDQLTNYENILVKYRDDLKGYKENIGSFKTQYDEMSGIINTNLVGNKPEEQYVEIKTFINNCLDQDNQYQSQISSLNEKVNSYDAKFNTVKKEKEILYQNNLALINKSKTKDKNATRLIETTSKFNDAVKSYKENVVEKIKDKSELVKSLAKDNDNITKAIMIYEKSIDQLSPIK
jgi:chromosome segregation ATPase